MGSYHSLNTTQKILSEDELLDALTKLEQSQAKVSDLEYQIRYLRQEIENQKNKRRSERERLATWLDRRIIQQNEALSAHYISLETKTIVEIEISILQRYRDYVVNNKERSPDEDPWMPSFKS